jgi:hypothetical protein
VTFQSLDFDANAVSYSYPAGSTAACGSMMRVVRRIATPALIKAHNKVTAA